jgi:hypothetical protein
LELDGLALTPRLSVSAAMERLQNNAIVVNFRQACMKSTAGSC